MYDVCALFASKCHSHTLSFSYLSMVHCQTHEGALVMMYSGGLKKKNLATLTNMEMDQSAVQSFFLRLKYTVDTR